MIDIETLGIAAAIWCGGFVLCVIAAAVVSFVCYGGACW